MAEHLWDGVAAAYDRSFATLCAGTAPALLQQVPGRSRVLDVGCGSGHLTAVLASAGHDVRAVDPDPEMVALARSRSAVDVRQERLPDLPFADGTFDVVVVNFVLNHVDDPRAAARGLPPVLRAGGRVLATIWPATPPPQAQLWSAVLDATGAARPASPRLAPELDFERSPEGLGDLLAGAGLQVTDATKTRWDWTVTPDDLWAGCTAVGNFGVSWRAQTPEVRDAMRDAFAVAARSWLVGDHLVFPVEAVMVSAVA